MSDFWKGYYTGLAAAYGAIAAIYIIDKWVL